MTLFTQRVALMRGLILLLVAVAATPSSAAQFTAHDLSAFVETVKAALGSGFDHRVETKRMILTCPTCPGAPMIDVQLGRQTDGTEGRLRSGQTSIGDMERLCQQRSAACRLAALDVAPAVGWITAYPIGSTSGSTAVILRGGDMLTVRSLASDAGIARSNAEKIVAAVAPTLVGK